MPVLRFCLRLSAIPPVRPATEFEIRPFDAETHGPGIAVLVAACRSADAQSAESFAPASLASELASRPGRAVHVRVAWSIGPRESVTVPIGLVTLVVAGQSGHDRFSIAWLLVHPATRRCGVASALVFAALERARDLGATEVFAETLSSWPAATAFWRQAAGRYRSSQPADPSRNASGK